MQKRRAAPGPTASADATTQAVREDRAHDRPFVAPPAEREDFIFCERLYFETMGWIIKTLDLDLVRHREGFAVQWRLAEIRIIMVRGEDVGWLQTEMTDDVVFLKQLYL